MVVMSDSNLSEIRVDMNNKRAPAEDEGGSGLDAAAAAEAAAAAIASFPTPEDELLHILSTEVEFDRSRFALLLRHIRDVNCTDEDGLTPLHYAAMRGDADMAATLLRAGADLYARERSQYTALHLAAWRNELAVASLLVERDQGREVEGGAGVGYAVPLVDMADRKGNTALIVAAGQGNLEMVRLLCERCRADPESENKSGDTAYLVAERNHHAGIAEYLAALLAYLKASLVDDEGEEPLPLGGAAARP